LPVFVGGRRLRLVPVAISLAVVLSACGGSGGKPQTLPPLSNSPSTTPTVSPTQNPKAAAVAVVREYYKLLNAPSTFANATALAALMTSDCPCRRVVEATRNVARKSQQYFGTNHLVSVTPSIDSRRLVEALVQYDYTDGGIKDEHGMVISRTAGRKDNLVRFVLSRRGDRWLIMRIDILKNGKPT
jgi:hypothetical protein